MRFRAWRRPQRFGTPPPAPWNLHEGWREFEMRNLGYRCRAVETSGCCSSHDWVYLWLMTSRKPDQQDIEWGRQIARSRKKCGWTQDELGAEVGVTGQQIGKYERGQSRISVVRYEAIMHVLKRAKAAQPGFAEEQAAFHAEVLDRKGVVQSLSVIRREVDRLMKMMIGR